MSNIHEAEQAFNQVNQETYRLHYHLMPPVGSLADPNGMCQIGDTYHIYYIYNPLACITDERTACVWGHYSTQDFVHFKREQIVNMIKMVSIVVAVF